MMLLRAVQWKLDVTIVYLLCEWNGYVSHIWVYLQLRNDSLVRDLLSEKSLTQFRCAIEQSYLNLTFSLSASICLHVPLWAGVEFRGGERETVTSLPFCFSCCGKALRVPHLVFTSFFSVVNRFSQMTKTISQFGHNYRKGRLVNTVQRVLIHLRDKWPKDLIEKNTFFALFY